MPVLAALLWFAQPAPLDMPRAEAYFVKGSDGLWLEDRYDAFDLWASATVLCRWRDEDGRQFMLSRLATAAPVFADSTLTRRDYAESVQPLPVKDLERRDAAIAWLSPFDPPEKPESPRLDVHGFSKVQYLHGTNETAVVCAFLPERSTAWYLATWNLIDGDDFDWAKELFERDFLAKWRERMKEGFRSELDRPEDPKPRKSRRTARADERELLRAATVQSVTNYPNWHVTSAPEFVVLDDLPPDNGAVVSLTNELAVMRAKYAEALPSPVNSSNVLAVARIFKDRDEYLDALEDNDVDGMEWSGAYWHQLRRELVAYLPQGGARELVKTFRHEAFHQYMSYACSMLPSSPWINEGYAQYFEDTDDADWKIEVDLERLAELLPVLMKLDYEGFYAGSPEVRQLKYRTAWSIAYFLEKGAPKVRFQPFKEVCRNYVEALLRHHDPQRATEEAFVSSENLKKFVAEWKKFWMNL